MLCPIPTPDMRTPLNEDIQSWPETWQAAYRSLEQIIAPNQLQTWIHPLKFIDVQPSETGLKARIVAPHPFSANWVRDNYKKHIETALTQVTGSHVELELLIQDQPADRREPY